MVDTPLSSYPVRTLTYVLGHDASNNVGKAVPASGGGGTPGGTDKQVQFNNASAFGGAANMWVVDPTHISIAGTSPQALQVYNISDNAFTPTNYERGVFDWTTTPNMLTIGTQNGGTGVARRLELASATGFITVKAGTQLAADSIWGDTNNFIGGTARWSLQTIAGYLSIVSTNCGLYFFGPNSTNPQINSDGNQFFSWSSVGVGATSGPFEVGVGRGAVKVLEVNDGNAKGTVGYLRLNSTTVSALPAAAATYKGCRATVSDATVSTFYTTVAGGGSICVPVFCDGAAWKIG